MKDRPRLFRKKDLLVLAAVFAFAFLLLLYPLVAEGERGDFALVVYEEGEILLPLDVDGDHVFKSNGHTLTLTVADGEIFVKESSCADYTCMRMGRISQTGETLLCAKAALSVRITAEGGFDGVAQ